MTSDQRAIWTRRIFILAKDGLLVFAGVLITNFLAGWLTVRLQIGQFALVAASLLFALIFCGVAVAAVGDIVRRSHHTAEDIAQIAARLRMDFRFEFVEDLEDDIGDYKARVFVRLKAEVAAASTSLRAVSVASVGDVNYLPAGAYHNKERDEYFRAIEDLLRVKRSSSARFEYKRVLQLSESPPSVPQSYRPHLDAVLALRAPSLLVDIKRVATSRMTGFLVIDGRTLILMLGGVLIKKERGADVAVPYPTTLLIFSGGIFQEFVETYTRYFDYLASKGASVQDHAPMSS